VHFYLGLLLKVPLRTGVDGEGERGVDGEGERGVDARIASQLITKNG
jgi:hypothetical protein